MPIFQNKIPNFFIKFLLIFKAFSKSKMIQKIIKKQHKKLQKSFHNFSKIFFTFSSHKQNKNDIIFFSKSPIIFLKSSTQFIKDY